MSLRFFSLNFDYYQCVSTWSGGQESGRISGSFGRKSRSIWVQRNVICLRVHHYVFFSSKSLRHSDESPARNSIAGQLIKSQRCQFVACCWITLLHQKAMRLFEAGRASVERQNPCLYPAQISACDPINAVPLIEQKIARCFLRWGGWFHIKKYYSSIYDAKHSASAKIILIRCAVCFFFIIVLSVFCCSRAPTANIRMCLA